MFERFDLLSKLVKKLKPRSEAVQPMLNGDSVATGILNSNEAARLVNLVEQAKEIEVAIKAAESAFSFLLMQLQLLKDRANGYPRNPISADVWGEGYALISVCDRFAVASKKWGMLYGEEQATKVAVLTALQVVAHYPEEIFPRVVRNAECCESLNMIAEAISGYRSVVGDFNNLQLKELIEDFKTLEIKRRLILTSTYEALHGLKRLAPDEFSNVDQALVEKLGVLFDSSTR